MPYSKSRANFFHVAGFTRIPTAIHKGAAVGCYREPGEHSRPRRRRVFLEGEQGGIARSAGAINLDILAPEPQRLGKHRVSHAAGCRPDLPPDAGQREDDRLCYLIEDDPAALDIAESAQTERHQLPTQHIANLIEPVLTFIDPGARVAACIREKADQGLHDAAIAAWRAEPRTTPGGQPHYSPGAGPGKRDPGAGTRTACRKAKEEGTVHRALPPHHDRTASVVVLRPQARRGARRDGVTWQDYEADLDRKIEDLHDRVHRGAYRAQPSRRPCWPRLGRNPYENPRKSSS